VPQPQVASAHVTGACLLWLLLACATAHGHDGVHDEIRAVDARLASGSAPVSALDLLQRGELHRLARDWRAAEADYRRAARLDPKLADVHLARAALALDRGRPRQARRELDPVLAQAPGDPRAHELRAHAWLTEGRPRAAAADLDHVIATSPRPTPDHYLARARALLSCTPPEHEKALRGLDEAATRLGPVFAIESFAFELELERGNLEGALARLVRVAAAGGRPEWVLEQRGQILAAAGDASGARAAFAAALCEIEELPAARRGAATVRGMESRLRAALAASTAGRSTAASGGTEVQP
jgi:tetratricopeptide (TPR) repeat protein